MRPCAGRKLDKIDKTPLLTPCFSAATMVKTSTLVHTVLTRRALVAGPSATIPSFLGIAGFTVFQYFSPFSAPFCAANTFYEDQFDCCIQYAMPYRIAIYDLFLYRTNEKVDAFKQLNCYEWIALHHIYSSFTKPTF